MLCRPIRVRLTDDDHSSVLIFRLKFMHRSMESTNIMKWWTTYFKHSTFRRHSRDGFIDTAERALDVLNVRADKSRSQWG